MENIFIDYEINERTMALLPAKNIEYQTIVLETERTLYVQKYPLELINSACLKAWCSYEGRRTAMMMNTGYKRKVPVPIFPDKKVYAFPTTSPESFECKWIFPSHVKDILKTSPSVILFNNEQELLVNESFRILERQWHRTAMCMVKTSPQLT